MINYTITLRSVIGPECDIVIEPWDEDPESDTVQIGYPDVEHKILIDGVDLDKFILALTRYKELTRNG